ncbi:ArnT family glycosyltransferase [Novosphingobium sp. Chol11]|jgi:hypothetical protein|uniref:ArnT family glycosyltransferase n=1 Tax=Novosphingobium sp. Chol11 TaxID=1385763 RepID=UPI000BE2224E|nr:glycosyltransferase family 39 protein [Novosphingobium sp. Chol11]
MYPFQPDEALARARSGIVLDRISAGGLPLLALLLFLLVTHHGIGIWPDSTRYMSLSSQPWDAPLYPALLQLVAMPGIDIVRGAWGIGLVLAPLNAFLAWYLIRTASGSPAAAALGTAIIMIAPQTVTLHGLAMSEPLFLTTIYGTLIALTRYLRDADRRWLIMAGIGIGLASLARFTGPALGAAIALFLLMDPRQPLPGRLANILRILIPSAFIFFGWVALGEAVNGRSTGRPLEWLGNMTVADWWLSFHAMTAWLLPDDVPGPARGAVFLLALGAGLFAVALHGRRALGRTGGADVSLLAVPLALFFFTYLAFMVLATSIEANLHMNGRYAYPIYCTSVMAAAITVAQLDRASTAARLPRFILIGIGCMMLASHAARTTVRTYNDYHKGVGYAALDWVRSPTIAAVARLPRNAVIYSNGPDVIGYLLRRPARDIPMHISLRIGREDVQFPYARQLASASAALARGNAYVVFLNGIDFRFYMASERELADRLNLVRVAKLEDGAIYRRAWGKEGNNE